MTSPNGSPADDEERVIALNPRQIAVLIVVVVVVVLLRRRCGRASGPESG